ncbi:MAG: hypothetical protein JO179_02055 [Solirubrobacterales bacterium]|nr:hypothetical protein [Solirubrobacterales bacterium]
MNRPEEFLRQLADNDEHCVRAVLSSGSRPAEALDRETRALVQLSALLAVDAATPSLSWAVDTAAAYGADDVALAQVLLCAGAAAGAAQIVVSAARLAPALGVDLEVEGWNLT